MCICLSEALQTSKHGTTSTSTSVTVHSGGTVEAQWAAIHPFCDHYSWPVASLVGMAILHIPCTLLKEMSTSASHSHTCRCERAFTHIVYTKAPYFISPGSCTLTSSTSKTRVPPSTRRGGTNFSRPLPRQAVSEV